MKQSTLLAGMAFPAVEESLRQLRPVRLRIQVVQDMIPIIECLLVVRAVHAIVRTLKHVGWVSDINKYVLAPAQIIMRTSDQQ